MKTSSAPSVTRLLLEYVGRGAVQANIFPIPPNGERRIELE